MLEKPDLPDEQLIACLQHDYGLRIVQVDFLPLGNDRNTAVYRVVADDARPYFLKLRRGAFDEITVAIPRLLSDQGMAQIIAPIATNTGRLWARMDAFALILSPFVAGQNGFEVAVSDRQRIEIGAALKLIHTLALPESLRQRIPREAYAPYWRDLVRGFQARAEDTAFAEPVAAQLTALLRAKRAIIDDLVLRAEQLAARLQTRSLEYVLCHADIHAWNLLIDANATLYIVDWDTLILAPKERDLMFVGAGLDDGRANEHVGHRTLHADDHRSGRFGVRPDLWVGHHGRSRGAAFAAPLHCRLYLPASSLTAITALTLANPFFRVFTARAIWL
jgi:spectinomycin phosphotransferase